MAFLSTSLDEVNCTKASDGHILQLEQLLADTSSKYAETNAALHEELGTRYTTVALEVTGGAAFKGRSRGGDAKSTCFAQ